MEKDFKKFRNFLSSSRKIVEEIDRVGNPENRTAQQYLDLLDNTMLNIQYEFDSMIDWSVFTATDVSAVNGKVESIKENVEKSSDGEFIFSELFAKKTPSTVCYIYDNVRRI